MLSEDEVNERQRSVDDFLQFLADKSAEDLVEVYRIMLSVELSDQMEDRFTTAMRAKVNSNEELALQVGRNLIGDIDPMLRLESFWVLQHLMFTHPEAQEIVWKRLLGDEDPEVARKAFDLLVEDLQGTETASLESVLYAAENIVKAKKRLE